MGEESSPPGNEAQGRPESARASRILVVDDNPLNLKITRMILDQIEANVDTAADGFEALEKVAERYYPLIFMDIQMPRMDGIETAKRIRRQRFAQGQPVIVAVTAFATESNRQRCLAEGMDGFLGKPVEASALQAVARRYLKPNPEAESPAQPNDAARDG